MTNAPRSITEPRIDAMTELDSLRTEVASDATPIMCKAHFEMRDVACPYSCAPDLCLRAQPILANNRLAALQAELSALKAQVEALRANDARYREVRRYFVKAHYVDPQLGISELTKYEAGLHDLDAAIDAALAKQEAKP